MRRLCARDVCPRASATNPAFVLPMSFQAVPLPHWGSRQAGNWWRRGRTTHPMRFWHGRRRQGKISRRSSTNGGRNTASSIWRARGGFGLVLRPNIEATFLRGITATLRRMRPDPRSAISVLGDYRSNGFFAWDVERLAHLNVAFPGRIAAVHAITNFPIGRKKETHVRRSGKGVRGLEFADEHSLRPESLHPTVASDHRSADAVFCRLQWPHPVAQSLVGRKRILGGFRAIADVIPSNCRCDTKQSSGQLGWR